MRYVALLRGINVGGANKISMAELKGAFEESGMSAVRTYINSGNVVFSTDIEDRGRLADLLQDAVRKRSGLGPDIQLRDEREFALVVKAIPAEWTNDDSMKCDVVFLQPDVDSPKMLEELGPRPGIEDAVYVPGAVIWRVDRKDAARSRLTRIVGTPLYSRVTVRNCNTVRKLHELLQAPDSHSPDPAG
jgi:uncharacterized protein (DUF1697 family)